MKSEWSDTEAAQFEADSSELGLRVYSSRLLGRDDSLVLHGGGNTSLKGTSVNIFGDCVPTLFVKGSGWDLKTIEAPGLPATCLNTLQRLAALESMTDTEMARELKLALLDPASPSPSVEAILHAIIPFNYVDHTHADAVVAISNTADGRARLESVYGEDVLVLPYIMPGFILARQVFEATRDIDWSKLRGIILEHHGVFSFADDARSSYETMIELVDAAESYLQQEDAPAQVQMKSVQVAEGDSQYLAAVRARVSEFAGRPMLAQLAADDFRAGYASRPDISEIAVRGPVTPDHTLHTKRIAAILEEDSLAGIDAFADDYRGYFERHQKEDMQCLDPAPRVAVWKDRGLIAFGPNAKRLGIVADIAEHTARCIQWAQALGGWQALPEQDIFELEYWELEQAKLKKTAAIAPFEGRVALVTGAASGIGRACFDALKAEGCAIIALDLSATVNELDSIDCCAVQCDVTDSSAVRAAIEEGVSCFGGIDILVSNAGNFPASARIADLDEDALSASMELNFKSHASLLRLCTPYLNLGINAAVVLMASKNVPAPGPGAAAYSAAKAALNQLGRVAALEMGSAGVRVNMLHPNAVYDTGVWTEEVLQARADSYGLTVEEYKTNNALGMEVRAADVASAIVALTGTDFPATTGAQIPIDGGNDRVI